MIDTTGKTATKPAQEFLKQRKTPKKYEPGEGEDEDEEMAEDKDAAAPPNRADGSEFDAEELAAAEQAEREVAEDAVELEAEEEDEGEFDSQASRPAGKKRQARRKEAAGPSLDEQLSKLKGKRSAAKVDVPMKERRIENELQCMIRNLA